jgi:hypothetical protein
MVLKQESGIESAHPARSRNHRSTAMHCIAIATIVSMGALSAIPVRGVVHDPEGTPVAGAVVFFTEYLDASRE